MVVDVNDQASVVQASRVRVLLYLALWVSAGIALFGSEELQRRILDGTLAPEFRLLPAAVFAATLALYAVDRVLLVRNRAYPSGKAFFQVAFGLVLLTFLLPGGLRDYQTGRTRGATPETGDVLLGLMRHPDDRVRALAVEVAGHREDAVHLPALVDALQDPSERVRTAASQALSRRTGQVLGSGADSASAWRAYINREAGGLERATP
jgi:hypothetical protein